MRWEVLRFLNKVSCATGIIWVRWVRSGGQEREETSRGKKVEKFWVKLSTNEQGWPGH